MGGDANITSHTDGAYDYEDLPRYMHEDTDFLLQEYNNGPDQAEDISIFSRAAMHHQSSAASCQKRLVCGCGKAVCGDVGMVDLPNANREHHPEIRTNEQLVSQALHDMSLQERDQVYQDLHCINESDNLGNPNFLDNCLEQLKAELQRHIASATTVTTHDGTILMKSRSSLILNGYLQAEIKNRDYVHDRDLLSFMLWAENYDIAQTAERMIRFFEFKRTYFNEDALARDVTYNDLTAEDRKYFRLGYCQTLPVRDQGNRMVHIMFNPGAVSYTHLTLPTKA